MSVALTTVAITLRGAVVAPVERYMSEYRTINNYAAIAAAANTYLSVL